jgi:hypothetical protein
MVQREDLTIGSPRRQALKSRLSNRRRAIAFMRLPSTISATKADPKPRCRLAQACSTVTPKLKKIFTNPIAVIDEDVG